MNKKDNNNGTIIAIIGIAAGLFAGVFADELVLGFCSVLFLLGFLYIFGKELLTDNKKSNYPTQMAEEDLLDILDKYVYNDKDN